MTARHEKIAEAHQKTYEWAYDNPDANLVDWLERGNGLFWINGKAGSGKSTLMKFLSDDPRTRQHLEYGVPQGTWLIASYFFDSGGSPLQKSQTGLLRSLLHQVMDENRDSIQTVCSAAWAMLKTHGGPEQSYKPELVWSLRDLLQAFQLMISHVPLQAKVFLLIDGLDEYEGDPHDLLELFRSMTVIDQVHPDLKSCVSSRPWPFFADAFDECPSLRLQDLTLSDIRTYIIDKLHSNKQMKRLRLEDPSDAKLLVDQIAWKASGVFLWVILVVKSMLDGLCNHDAIPQLLERVDDLPDTLENLFESMLSRTELRYQSEALRIFRIMEASRVSYHSIPALQLWYAHDDLVKDMSDHFQSLGDVMARLDDIDRRLQSRCAGLLEIKWGRLDRAELRNMASHNDPTGDDPTLHHEELLMDGCFATFETSVQYIHKTVQDYLEIPDTRAKLNETTQVDDFDPYHWLHRAFLNQVKIISNFFSHDSPRLFISKCRPYFYAIDGCMHYAGHVEERTGKALAWSLEELDRVVKHRWNPTIVSEYLESWMSDYESDGSMDEEEARCEEAQWRHFLNDKSHHWCALLDIKLSAGHTRSECLRLVLPNILSLKDTFLSFAVRKGLCLYVQETIQQPGFDIGSKPGMPLLHYIFEDRDTLTYRIEPWRPRMLEILLRSGANSNEGYPWPGLKHHQMDPWLKVRLWPRMKHAEPLSVWQKLLVDIVRSHLERSQATSMSKLADITEDHVLLLQGYSILLEHEADPNAAIIYEVEPIRADKSTELVFFNGLWLPLDVLSIFTSLDLSEQVKRLRETLESRGGRRARTEEYSLIKLSMNSSESKETRILLSRELGTETRRSHHGVCSEPAED